VIEAGEWYRLAGSVSGSSQEPGEDEDFVWGVAYRIDPEKEDEVRAYLEYREKNGYTSHDVQVFGVSPSDGKEIIVVPSATIWIGRLDNPAFVGYEPIHKLSKTIYESHGPSGPNKDYLYKLAESVRRLYPNVRDEYLFELEDSVRTLENRSGEMDGLSNVHGVGHAHE